MEEQLRRVQILEEREQRKREKIEKEKIEILKFKQMLRQSKNNLQEIKKGTNSVYSKATSRGEGDATKRSKFKYEAENQEQMVNPDGGSHSNLDQIKKSYNNNQQDQQQQQQQQGDGQEDDEDF